MDHRANDIMEYPFDTFTVPTHRLFLLPCTLLVPTYIHAFFPRLDDQKMEEIKVWKVLLLIMFSNKSFGCVKKIMKKLVLIYSGFCIQEIFLKGYSYIEIKIQYV